MGVVMDFVKLCDIDCQLYESAGGMKFQEAEKIHQMLKILPSTLSMEMLMKTSDFKTADELRDWMYEKSTFIQQHGGKDGHAHAAEYERRSRLDRGGAGGTCSLA